MTGASRSAGRSFQPAVMALAGGAATFVAILVLGSRTPLLLLAAPIGAICLVWAAHRPVVALVIMVVVEVTNLSGVLAPYGGLPLFQASMLLGVLAVGLALRDPAQRARLNAWTAICAAFFVFYLATQALAAIGSTDAAASAAALYRLTLDLAFALLLLILVQLTGRPWTMAAAIAVPIAVLAALTLVNQVLFGGTASFGGFSTVTTASGEGITTLRYGGPLPDSNFWGRHLVIGLPIAAALLTRALRSGRRTAAGWVLAVLALLAGIYLTQSRGTFVSAAVAILAWFLVSERPVRRLGLAALPFAVASLAIPGIGDRLTNAFQDLLSGRTHGNIDPSLLGRVAAQQQSVMMWQERPFFGFGPGTFPGQVIEFAGRVPLAVREPTDAPHNTYAELAAESGINGLLGWAVIIAGFLAVLSLRVITQPRSRDRVLVAAVCSAIVGWSFASFGLHLAYFRTFGVVLALAGGLVPNWPVPIQAVRRLGRGVGVWSAAGLLGFGAFWACWSLTGSRVVTARQAATLVPVGSIDGWFAYALDVRSRIEFLPTFAILLRDPGSPVRLDADPVRGLLTFAASADAPTGAVEQVRVAFARAESLLHSSLGYEQYTLAPISTMRVTPTTEHSALDRAASAGLGIAVGVATAIAVSRATARRPEDEAVAEPATAQAAPR